MLAAYARIHENMLAWYQEKLPRPEDMKPEAYKRNIAARAFDVARYCLFFGIPTGVGQVVSIRTLEKQVRRLKASPYQELRELGDEIGRSVARPADCGWTAADANEPVAPTLTKFVDAEEHPVRSKADLTVWARQNLATSTGLQVEDVDLMRPSDTMADAVACLLYEVTDRPYRELYDTVSSWSESRRMEVIDVAMQSRTRRDELLRSFRGGPYVYDIVMDIGAYRECTAIVGAFSYGKSMGPAWAIPCHNQQSMPAATLISTRPFVKSSQPRSNCPSRPRTIFCPLLREHGFFSKWILRKPSIFAGYVPA